MKYINEVKGLFLSFDKWCDLNGIRHDKRKDIAYMLYHDRWFIVIAPIVIAIITVGFGYTIIRDLI